MPMSTRGALAMGLGLSLMVAGGLVGRSLGQSDGGVRKVANTPGQSQTVNFPPMAAAVIAAIDMEAAFKNYEKTKACDETFKAEAMAKNAELQKMAAEGRKVGEELEKLDPKSADHKKLESQYTELKAKFQATKEAAESEFAQREGEALSGIYKDIQDMAAAIAKKRGCNYVVRISRDPVQGPSPDVVAAMMSRSVVWADQTVDITNDVIRYLNARYRASGGTPPKADSPKASSRPAPTAEPGKNGGSR
jgi:Skp family chaperone for outer membrane proteins